MIKGTTPQGRDLLRKILCRTERLLQTRDQTKQSIEQIVAEVEAEFTTFKSLKPEFAISLGRWWGRDLSDWGQLSDKLWALFVVIRTAYVLKTRAAL